VGKHAAPEGSAVHPLVAGALARRAADGPDGHGADGHGPAGHAVDEQGEQSPAERTGRVGWPAPPAPGGGGLGWPGGDPAEATGRPVAEVPAVAQRGWRRLFRLRPAA
jgi:hypothetical protein